MEQEHKSVKKMWEDYLKSIGEDSRSTVKSYDSWYFCDNEKDAYELAELVKQGVKRGTSSLHYLCELEGEELSQAGDLSIITNYQGIAQCIIQTKKVTVLPFKDVTEEYAIIEGEGDKSLKYWQNVHIEVFSRELKDIGKKFSEDMLIEFEEFVLVYKD